MPRSCILCGKCQSHSFSVFSFPTSFRNRNAWLKVLLEANPDFMKDKKLFANNKLKNGVCENHFLLSEISNGKKRRLNKNAVPSLLILKSPQCNTIVRKYNTLLRSVDNAESLSEAFMPPSTGIDILTNHNISKEHCHDISLPDCTIEIEDKNDSLRIYKSVVNDLTKENKGYCLCCGLHIDWKCLYSISKLKVLDGSRLMLDELVNVFDVPQERITMFSKYICGKCLKLVIDLLEIKNSFYALLGYLKRKLFSNINSDDFNNIDKQVIISDEKNSPIEDEKHSLTLTDFTVNKSTFPCIDCPEKFETLSAFCTHLAIHGKDDTSSRGAKYDCSHCDKKFLTKSSLLFHKKSHQQNSSGQECGQRFTVKNRTNSESIRRKEHEKVPKCSISETMNTEDRLKNKSLNKVDKQNLLVYQKHKTYAHSEKNIVCEKCGDKFLNSSELNTHMNTKHQDATVACNMCDENFASLFLYKDHLALNHKKEMFSGGFHESRFSEKELVKQRPLKCTIKNSDINTSFNNECIMHLQAPDADSTELIVVKHEVCSNKNDDESTHVLTNIFKSDKYENSNIRKLELPTEMIKASKIVGLSNEKVLCFHDNIPLKNHSVVNDINYGKDVPLVNVQMLKGIEVQHLDTESMNDTDESEIQAPINLIDVLESGDIKASNVDVQSTCSLLSKQAKLKVEMEDVGVIQGISSPLPTSEIIDDHVVQLIEPLTMPLLNQSDLPDISDSLRSPKNNWDFPNSLEHSVSSVNHAIHSLDVHEVDLPATREIDINVPSDDDETKVDPLSSHPSSKLGAHDLPSFSVGIDGKGDVRYVMYFEDSLDK